MQKNLNNESCNGCRCVSDAVSSVSVVNKQRKYRVGEKIECMANGNPEPTYQWINSKGSKTVDGNILDITGKTISFSLPVLARC